MGMALLGDFISIKHGYAFKGNFISTEDNGIVLVTPGNFAVGGGFKENKCKYFTGDYPEDYVLNPNDLIVTMTDLSKNGDTLGYSALIPDTSRIYLHNQRIGLIQIKSNKLSKDYLYWFMRTRNYQKQIVATASGSTVKHTSPSRICEIEINMPPLEKQERIANLLNNVEGKIKNNNSINNNLLQQLDTLYDEFIHRENWSTVTINDIAEKIAMGPFGSNIKVSTFVSNGIPIISGNHLRGYFLEEPSFNYITEEHAQHLKNSLVYPKDIVFTHAGNIGQVAMIPADCRYPMYVLSQRQFYLRCNIEKAVPEYVILFFHSKQGQHELLSYANQTGVPSIAQPTTNLKKISLKLPPMGEQRQWLQLVSPIIKLYQSNIYENEHLSGIRDSLLPKLMSGELDVSDIDL